MAEPIETLKFKFRWLGKDGLKAMRKASRKAGEILRDEASRLAPRLKGTLQDEMTMRTRKESDSSIELEVGPSKKAWYARFVERGTKPHMIRPRRAKVLAAGNSMSINAATFTDFMSKGAVFGMTVHHPGIKATPFLGPAVESKGDEAAAVYWFVFNQSVDKAFEKMTA